MPKLSHVLFHVSWVDGGFVVDYFVSFVEIFLTLQQIQGKRIHDFKAALHTAVVVSPTSAGVIFSLDIILFQNTNTQLLL